MVTQQITDLNLLTLHADIQVGDTVYTAIGGRFWLIGQPKLAEGVVTVKTKTGRLAVKSPGVYSKHCTYLPFFKTREAAFAYWRQLASERFEILSREQNELRAFMIRCHD